MANPVTLKALAKKTGLSVAAVSYALRGSPKVSPETAAAVRAAAAALGYRPNARVAELMAHIRTGRKPQAGDVLALVWLDGRRKERNAFREIVEAGAVARAKARGFRLEPFWLDEVENSPRRLAGILKARGVGGIVFGPVQRWARVELEWTWDEFGSVVIGMAEWGQPVSRAGHHHFEAMRRVMQYLQGVGAKAPACWLSRESDERAHRGWRAGWLAGDFRGAAGRLRLDEEASPAERAGWLARLKPDALVVSHREDLAKLRLAGWRGNAARTILLDWREGCDASGVDQGYDLIAGSAVDMLVAQLQRNERGLPDPPQMLLFPGRWRAAGGEG